MPKGYNGKAKALEPACRLNAKPQPSGWGFRFLGSAALNFLAEFCGRSTRPHRLRVSRSAVLPMFGVSLGGGRRFVDAGAINDPFDASAHGLGRAGGG